MAREEDDPGNAGQSPPQAQAPERWHAPKEAFERMPPHMPQRPRETQYSRLPFDQVDDGPFMAGADRRNTPTPLRQAAQVAEAAGAFNTPAPPHSAEAPSGQSTLDQAADQIAALQPQNSAAVLEGARPPAPYPAAPSLAGAPTLTQNHVLTAADLATAASTIGTAALELDTAPPSVEVARTLRRTARTTVGAAVLANGASIVLALAGLQIRIEEKLASLKEGRFNSDEKHQEIADYEDLKQKVDAILDATVRFFAGAAKEETLVKDAKSFAATLRDIWNKRHSQFSDVGLLVSSVGVCHLMGVDSNLAAVISGALVGRKAVVDALKTVFGKGE